MSARRRMPRSPYERDESSAWDDSQREKIREAFIDMNRDDEDIEKFISEAETLCTQLVTLETRPSTEIAQSLKDVEEGADELLKALARLKGDAMSRFRTSALRGLKVDFVSAYFDVDNRLAEHWQIIVLIRDAAEQAHHEASKKRGRGNRSNDRRGLQIVQCLRLVWKVTWGQFPPISRGTEFEMVAAAVGSALGVKIGRAALANATLSSLAR